ncbi:MAG: peptidoglycan DD-metalloendopeptidase family protein [Pseudomonadota bacterium]
MRPTEALLFAATAALVITFPSAASTQTRADLAGFAHAWHTGSVTTARRVLALRQLAAVPPTRPGQRRWPVEGRIVGRFGDRDGPIRLPGIRLAVPSPAVVRAPATGTVAFADDLPGIGLVLIIDHGDEYHSVLGGLDAIDVAAGTAVVAGERVGRLIGEERSNDVMIELRREGRPVDPLPWLETNRLGDGE